MKRQNRANTQYINSEELPLVITPENSGEANLAGLLRFLEENHEVLLESLLYKGSVLFRGYSVTEPEEFSQVVKACKLGEFMPYLGGTTPRTMLSEGVFTSTEAPPSMVIRLHNEMSYSENFPKHLYFCCNTAPAVLGATPLADARKVYASLDEALRNRLEEKGVLYRRFLFGDDWLQKRLSKMNKLFMPWDRIYGTQDRALVEEKLRAAGANFEWLPNNKGLRTSIRLPAFRTHPVTGERVWFNQINQFNDFDSIYHFSTFGPNFSWLFRYILLNSNTLPTTTSYGDGSPFSEEDIRKILKALDENIVRFPWERGDLLVIDNYLAMHAREPFKGPRKIMASLTT